jgi:hypothetical protein
VAEFAHPILAAQRRIRGGAARSGFSWWRWRSSAPSPPLAALAVIVAPGIRHLLLKEDGIVETGTVLFLAAAVFGAAASTLRRGPRVTVVLAGLIGFAELLDETSFGARLFGLPATGALWRRTTRRFPRPRDPCLPHVARMSATASPGFWSR